MYKKISYNERTTRIISESHSADNYLTKETTKNVSLAITKLNGKLESNKINNERVYYFISADVIFIILFLASSIVIHSYLSISGND